VAGCGGCGARTCGAGGWAGAGGRITAEGACIGTEGGAKRGSWRCAGISRG
jgi:hypothetical protein